MQEFEIDLVTVSIGSKDIEKGIDELNYWASETSYFVMALIDGLFWTQQDPVSFEEFIMGISGDNSQVLELIQLKKNRALELIDISIDNGANGIIIGDDVAYNMGPYVSPKNLERLIFPGHQEMAELIKGKGATAFLHSCGNLSTLMNMILSLGFDGLHGLSPSAGNDPVVIKNEARNTLTLMGVFEPDVLNPLEMKGMKDDLLPILSEEGGYILGSSAGLSVNTPIDSFRALYDQ
jgi:uroporphyrinogen decarboxylase